MTVVVIGAGHGGATAAIELRRAGYVGAITLIGDEQVIPYQRPPLSKAWLTGGATHDTLALRPAKWYLDNGIQLVLDKRVVQIDRVRLAVRLSDGTVLGYSKLIIATGARARHLMLPGADLPGVLTLRNTRDADQLKGALKPGVRVAMIGGGYVGLETAASARSLGAQVTLIEREARVLARVACPTLSEFFTHVHRAHGVLFELAAEVVRFSGSHRVEAIELTDGRVIACEVAIVGVGAAPNEELAQQCGLTCADGVVVDARARTSDENILAVGDVTRRPLARYERQVRLESVPNAVEQARQAAAAICARGPVPDEVPWFWSDQYDLRLQIAGLAFDCADNVVRGDPSGNRFAVYHLRGDQVEAVEAVNAPGDFVFAKSLIACRTPIDRLRLADAAVPLRETVR